MEAIDFNILENIAVSVEGLTSTFRYGGGGLNNDITILNYHIIVIFQDGNGYVLSYHIYHSLLYKYFLYSIVCRYFYWFVLLHFFVLWFAVWVFSIVIVVSCPIFVYACKML